MKTQLKYTEDEILISSHFHPKNNEFFRSCGGKFDRNESVWRIPISSRPQVLSRYGHGPKVIVHVSAPDWDGKFDSDTMTVGPYVLVSRPHRDYSAKYHDAVLVEGEIPSRGGSIKNPRVNPSEDAVFRLEVPRSFAEARGLQIVEEPGATEISKALAPFTTEELEAEIKRRKV